MVAGTSYAETIRARTANSARNWTDPKGPDPLCAKARFEKREFFDVQLRPKFQFASRSRIYTIGSCFARNVEKVLAEAGADLPTLALEVDPEVYVSQPHFKTTALNKYNPASMAAEILRGIGALDIPDNGLICVGDDKWCDPQSSHIGAMTREQAVKLRTDMNRIAAEISSCDVVLMTLGLTETWWDTETGMAFNGLNPAAARSQALRERMYFANVTADQAYGGLKTALLALREKNPSVKVVVTVSPVPMNATFTTMDVVTANTYSKATLRVAAQMLYETLDFVDYYPSYEMVVNSDRAFAWNPDQVHVHDRAVRNVIRRFLEAYTV